MIEELYVKDYVLFEKANIDFSNHMSVITGETGAGKSLLIDAISLLSGQRSTSNVVRKDANKTILQMRLSKPSQEVLNLLEENDYDIEEDILIQRTITVQGKSSMKINNQPATLSFVRQIVSKMVDVHSQMDTYQLMDPNVQLDLLDCFANCEALKNEVKNLYQIYARASNELKKAQEETFSDDALEYATAQYNEINDADIKEGELEELSNRIKEVANAQKTLEDLNESIYTLDKDGGLIDSLYNLKKSLQRNYWDTSIENLDDIYYEFVDLSEELKNRREDLQRDTHELDKLQEREYLIKRLYRKHGQSYEGLMKAKEQYMETIDKIIHRQAVLERLSKEKEEALTLYQTKAESLSKQRKSVFNDLSSQIETHFKDLMLKNARFKVDVQRKEPSANGIDDINFVVSMNPGQPFSLLKDSASGGELSRLMLALKVVFQSQQGIDTIIFDEIDTGVSGKVAYAMGHKMKTLSKDYQVLCITHLASVAAWADHHYRVAKNSQSDSTLAHVEELSDQQVLEELALMSSGSVSKASLMAAKELKERTNQDG